MFLRILLIATVVNELDIENINIGLMGSFMHYLDYYQIVIGLEPLLFPNPGEILWLDSNNYLCSEDDYYFEFFYTTTDVNADGNWDITDIILTVNYILGDVDLPNLQQYFADLNEDNIINVIDILIMVDIILN